MNIQNKVFIFGANGMLGNYVKNYLLQKNINIVQITRNDYDLSNISIESLNNFLISKDLKENDVIINCAGIIPQASKDKDLNKNLYYKINSIYPVILSMIAFMNKTQFIHITTDCVFSGKDGKYNEKSIHDEINDYGVSKSLGELCNGTIIRTSIIGEEVQYKRSLVEWVKSNKDGEINGYINHYWNGVTCLQLAKIIYKIINEDLYWNGIRHIYSPTTVNKYQLCNMINKIFELNINIKEFNTEKVDKSIISIYNTNSLFNIPELELQIKEMCEL
jgi:dTDP-4-dehydrorhamnose reductase